MLKIWLPLNGDLHNQGLDDVTVTNNGATINNNGKIGKCYEFNGSSYMKVSLQNLSEYSTTACSMCVWAKFPTASSGNKQLLNIGTSSGWANIRFGILYQTGAAKVLTSISDGTNYVTYSCNANITENDWNHVSAVYNNKILKIYVNGVLANTFTTTYDISFTGITEIGIGAAPNGAEKFTGSLCDIRIYSHALSVKEVKEISKGLVLHYPLSDPYAEGTTNLLPLNSQNFTETGVGAGSYSYNTSTHGSYTLSGYITCRSTDKAWTNPRVTLRIAYSDGTFTTVADSSVIVMDGKERYFSLTATSNTSKTVTSVNGWILDHSSGTTGKDATVRHAQLEMKDHATPYTSSTRDDTTVYDVSGNNYNGTSYSSFSSISDTPRYTMAMHFTPGSGVFAHPSITFSQFTIAFWARHTATGKMLFGSNASPSSLNSTWYWYGDNSFKYPSGEFYYEHNAGSDRSLLNKWTFFVATYDGAKVTVYRNGIYEGNKAVTGDMLLDYVSIGNGFTSSNYWEDGDVSDFRIYATALSADDILELYHTPASITSNGVLMTQGEIAEV